MPASEKGIEGLNSTTQPFDRGLPQQLSPRAPIQCHPFFERARTPLLPGALAKRVGCLCPRPRSSVIDLRLALPAYNPLAQLLKQNPDLAKYFRETMGYTRRCHTPPATIAPVKTKNRCSICGIGVGSARLGPCAFPGRPARNSLAGGAHAPCSFLTAPCANAFSSPNSALCTGLVLRPQSSVLGSQDIRSIRPRPVRLAPVSRIPIPYPIRGNQCHSVVHRKSTRKCQQTHVYTRSHTPPTRIHTRKNTRNHWPTHENTRKKVLRKPTQSAARYSP